jgi:NADH-quinone oxidoreductase subunit A
MTPSSLNAYVPLLIHLVVAMFVAGALILVSTFIGWRRPHKTKSQPYECGITPTGDPREPFSVKFYLVAMVFILCDAEAIFFIHGRTFSRISRAIRKHADTASLK